MNPELHSEVEELLASLVPAVRAELATELVGIWLWGSATLGGYRPGRSDVDLLVGLTGDHDLHLLERIRGPHDAIVRQLPSWHDRVEAAYVGMPSLRIFREHEHVIARISPGEPLNLRTADRAWLVDWWQVRTHGITLVGPPAAEVVPAIDVAELRAHLSDGLTGWSDADPTSWSQSYASYVVLGIARAHHAIATGRQASKQDAGRWLGSTHERWAQLASGAVEAHVGGAEHELLADAETLHAFLAWSARATPATR